jgi:NTE family protein
VKRANGSQAAENRAAGARAAADRAAADQAGGVQTRSRVAPEALDSASSLATAPEERILVLQGGGALGAYQAGAYEALCAGGEAPSWVAGISIGAINAALIAGNPPEQRLPRLQEFWQSVTDASFAGFPGVESGSDAHGIFNEVSALATALFGRPGFFKPRFPPPVFQIPGTPGALSLYDTSPLQATLERLVDFDLLNKGAMRLSVGAVNVRTGNFAYFDSSRQKIDVRHIMASAALPPGFPPVQIGSEWYWDGGLLSNTPLDYVLDQAGTPNRLIFQIDLFAATGPLPVDLAQVVEREKDIRFSSRTRLNTNKALQRQALAEAARRLFARLPDTFADDPDLILLKEATSERAVTVVHLIYRRVSHETHSKDYEFSRLSMLDHWRSGATDVAETLESPRWKKRPIGEAGIHVFDLTRRRP